MGSISTFGTYSLARLGIYAAQNSIAVTGNNIANVNTEGYTRQQANQVSMSAGGADKFQSTATLKIGNGTLVKSIDQLRDQYLDLRYRDAQADVGAVDAGLAIQQQLAKILDEVGDGVDGEGVLEAHFNEMIEQLENMKTQGVGDDRYETLFRSAATTVTDQLNAYANQLESLYDNTAQEFKKDVDKVNEMLEQIRDLNSQIRKSNIYGGDALELKDQRNNLIDQLSYYIDIKVTTEQEDLGDDLSVDRLVIRAVSADTDKEDTILIFGVYGSQLSYDTVDETSSISADGAYALTVSSLTNAKGVTWSDEETAKLSLDDLAGVLNGSALKYDPDTGLYTLYDGEGTAVSNPSVGDITNALAAKYPDAAGTNVSGKSVNQNNTFTQNTADGTFTRTLATVSAAHGFGDTELYGGLQSEREMLTESGSYASIETNPYLTADKNAVTKRGIPYYQKALDTLANSFAEALNKANIEAGGKALFSTSSTGNDWGYTYDESTKEWNRILGQDTITASNISISNGWANGSVYVMHGDENLSTDPTNLIRMLGILTNDREFTVDGKDPGKIDGTDQSNVFFTGSFQQLFTNHMMGNLATDIATREKQLDNYETILDDVYTERDGIQGVSLDDEAMNMMQFQQAFNAACRLMTTYDEMLDKLINGT